MLAQSKYFVQKRPFGHSFLLKITKSVISPLREDCSLKYRSENCLFQNTAELDGASIANFQQKIMRVFKKII